jgi:cyclopropane fatty-acyl-phospholipid synthase-like methyltransferase
MSMKIPVPPYFDQLIEGFRRGTVGRFVHLGHWEPPFPAADAPGGAGEFEQAQARLNAVLLGMAGLQSGQSVLDVGCGFGGTLDAVNHAFSNMALAGLNIDPRQLDICRTIEPAKGNRLRWEQGDACRLPFPDRSFDRVLCIEAMFHFGSRRAFFEAARVLCPAACGDLRHRDGRTCAG